MFDLGHALHELVTDWIVRRVADLSFAAVRRLVRRIPQHSRCTSGGVPMSYASEVVADSSGKWCGNALRFATHEEAAAYGRDLFMRWTAVREARVVESDDPVNYVWSRSTGRAKPIEVAS